MNEFTIQAQEILLRMVDSWSGRRKNYSISIEELEILVKAGAGIKKAKHNKDGTFYYKVQYQNLIFVSSSLRELPK
ncbi:MAG: hypothetical protein WC456_03645 [Patescibacteria group bacterium]